VGAKPGGSQPSKSCGLSSGDGLNRLTVRGRTPSFDFDDGDISTTRCHDVDFTPVASPVAIEDAIALGFKVPCSEVFSVAANGHASVHV
jgi:hypothetical protein